MTAYASVISIPELQDLTVNALHDASDSSDSEYGSSSEDETIGE